jgi:hypothetical protein
MSKNARLRASLVLTLLMLPVLDAAWDGASGRPGPQWADVPQNIASWFRSLMQPDAPNVSCCGEADAFEADDFAVEGDHYVAVITDGKGIIPNGTRISVPNHKINWQNGNPTGHGIIFLSGETWVDPDHLPLPTYVPVMTRAVNDQGGVHMVGRWLYCYVPPSGV